MAHIRDYKDMQVGILQATENPAAHVGIAISITMKNNPDAIIKRVSQRLCFNLINAEHTSLFEHVVYCFLIEGVSRSFLAQITRQRTASPTSGSQHYQIYSDYPMAIDTTHSKHLSNSLHLALSDYNIALDEGVPREEARQILPGACTVNYLWTIDARNLMFFLRQRLCNRNVLEMRIFAHRVLSLVRGHFPELFNNVGPQCFNGTCHQGALSLQCKEANWTPPMLYREP